MTGSPIQKKTLSAQVADEIRRRILSGEYCAGLQLRQEHVAAEMGISRIPVREGLHQLHSEGFVTLVSHKGAVVSAISVEEVAELFDIRVRVETWLLELAIPNMVAADLSHARACADVFSEQRNDTGSLNESNWTFHAALYAPSRRVHTVDMMAKIYRQLERYTRLMLTLEGNQRRVVREHLELLKLCRKRDVPGAVTLLASHIKVGGDLLVERLTVMLAAEAR